MFLGLDMILEQTPTMRKAFSVQYSVAKRKKIYIVGLFQLFIEIQCSIYVHLYSIYEINRIQFYLDLPELTSIK